MTTSDQLKAFARTLWVDDDLVELRPLPPTTGQRRWTRAGELPGLTPALERENQAGANLYAGVLPRKHNGGKEDDCLPGRVIWADFDGITPRQAWRQASGAGVPKPTLVLDSGHGAHLYWRLTEKADPEALSSLVGDLAVLVGSDPAVKDRARIMRLPGFMNHKDPPSPAELLYCDPENIYRFADLRESVPTPATTPTAPSPPTPTGDQVVDRARKYASMVDNVHRGKRNAAAFKLATVLVNDFELAAGDALPILGGWNAGNAPPLSENELSRVLESAQKHAKRPPGGKAQARPAKPTAPAIKPTNDGGSDLREELERERRGERQTLSLPWPRLSLGSRLLRPGSVSIIAGPAGYGKSMFVLQLLIHAHYRGESWALLPLEDRKVDVERRTLAHLSGEWAAIGDDTGEADYRLALLAKHQHALDGIGAMVWENPRLPQKNERGETVVPPLPYTTVLDWLGKAKARVICIDPWAQIDFGDRDPWRGEKDFIRKAVGITADTGSTLIIIAHTVKRPGAARGLPLSGEDIQGAAELKRLSHTVVLLDHHDKRESEVWRMGNMTEKVEHDRTVILDKSRYGPGAGGRYAYKLDGPAFSELGVIAPKRS